MIEFFGILFLLFLLSIPITGIWLLNTPLPIVEKMTFEEEMNWLMKDFDLTKEEAEEIANM
jgi:hypothetical protein